MPPSTLGTPPDPTVGPGEAATLDRLPPRSRRASPIRRGHRRETRDAGDESVGTKAVKRTHSTNNSRSDDSTNDCTTRFFILHGGEASTQIAPIAPTRRARAACAPRAVAMDASSRARWTTRLSASPSPCSWWRRWRTRSPRRRRGRASGFFNRKRKAGERVASRRRRRVRGARFGGHQPSSGPADHHGEGLQPGGADAGLRAAFSRRGAARDARRGE